MNAPMKSKAETPVLSAKFCCHWVTAYQATGTAIIKDTVTSVKYLRNPPTTKPDISAPYTFLTAISLLRYCTSSNTCPNTPISESAAARRVNSEIIFPCFTSGSYRIPRISS